MSKQTEQLRFNGYSVDSAGNLICNRVGETDRRYAHERTAVIRLDLERDAKPARELIARALRAVDEPRSLAGVARNGSTILLFKCDDAELVEPSNRSGTRQSEFRFEFQSESLTLTVGARGQVVGVADYRWQGDRSPLTVPRDSLPPLFDDIGEALVEELWKLGAREVTRENWYAASVAAERKKFNDECERAGQDPRLAAAGITQIPVNPDSDWGDGVFQGLRHQARKFAAAVKS